MPFLYNLMFLGDKNSLKYVVLDKKPLIIMDIYGIMTSRWKM